MKVLLVQPSLDPPGGGNLVAAWMLEALRGEHALSLLTWQPPDVAACNRHYGTSLRGGDFAIYSVPALARRLGRLSPTPLALLKDAYLMRRGQALAADHDLVLTCNNEGDFGRRAIQYIHYPKLDRQRPAVDLRWYHASRGLVALYYRAAARVARLSPPRMKQNLTLVNSAYMAARVRTLHGIAPIVLHPPVPGDFPAIPWAERDNGFVCVGRLSREKRIDTIVDILRRVRAGGDDVTLDVVGIPDDRTHVRVVRRLAREHAAWMRVHLDVPRDELIRLMTRRRYGIHAMRDEHFGIAVAEMVRAGTIPFVSAGGGPVEIVGTDTLCWSDPTDAVAKIRALLHSPERQSALCQHLAGRAALFSAERFCAALRALVRDFSALPA